MRPARPAAFRAPVDWLRLPATSRPKAPPTLARLLAGAALAFSVLALPAATAAASTCTTTTTTTYSIDICITAPAAGATLTGNATVTGTATVTSGTAAVQRFVFTLDGNYLLTDYQAPYTFTLPTARWVDGAHTLAVSALLKDGSTTSATSLSLTFSNGTTTPWAGTTTPFSPTSGSAGSGSFVVAAAGDGAGGETTMTNVVNMVKGWNPNLLLYLGDVYENGSPSEFLNWYDPGYGQFHSITDPVIGNHEYQGGVGGAGYFSYWGPNSDTYSFDAGGWHFIALNSEISGPAWTAQLNWLQNDLAAHAGDCTVATWHEPLFNVGPEGSNPRTQQFWTLLANAHATLVLNGHDHTYQRWTAMDATGVASPTGLTEIVAGVGGHSTQTITGSDSRVLASTSGPGAYGAVKLTLSASAINLQFLTTASGLFDSATIPCQGSKPGTGAVSGTITDAVTGAAIAGATVSAGGTSAATNASGAYTLSGLTVGTQQVTAAATGHVSQTGQVAVTAGHTSAQSFSLWPKVGRYAGSDRFGTAAAVSAHTFAANCGCTAYIANAWNFPDALAGAAAAGTVKGPVLLVDPTGAINASTDAELKRLNPKKIVILGGTAVVGTDVETALATYVGGSANVSRDAGSDRFGTAAAVSASTFAAGCGCTAYIANAWNFPDALAGAAAAGTVKGPVLLVDPTGAINASTDAELKRLNPNKIVILGGTAVVGTDVEAALATYVGGSANVSRDAGSDRFGTAAAVSQNTFAAGCGCVVYVADAWNFPDALAGAASAGTIAGPVLLVSATGAVDPSTATELQRLKPVRIVVLGGTTAVSSSVASALAAFVAP